MININKATGKELRKIINIGPIRANLIIDNRPYRDIYEISTLFGLGTKRMADIINQGIITI